MGVSMSAYESLQHVSSCLNAPARHSYCVYGYTFSGRSLYFGSYATEEDARDCERLFYRGHGFSGYTQGIEWVEILKRVGA